jgi:hypothetical protein
MGGAPEALLPCLFNGGYSAVTMARHSAGSAERVKGGAGFTGFCGLASFFASLSFEKRDPIF